MKKYWDQVEIGQSLPVLMKDSINRLHIAHFAAASDDFSPMYLDEEFAKSTGLGSVCAPNLLAVAAAEEALNGFAINMRILSLSSTFQRLIWPNDTLNPHGFIIRRYQKNDEHRVQFSLWVENQNGDVVMKGHAVLVMFKNAEQESRLNQQRPPLSDGTYQDLVQRCEEIAGFSIAKNNSGVKEKAAVKKEFA